MPPPRTPQRSRPSWLNAHLPPFRRRVNSSDEEEPERPVWPPRRPRLDFDLNDFEQEEDTAPEPPRHRKGAKRSANLFIDAEAGVDGEASNDEKRGDDNDNLDGFIVAKYVEFYIINQLSKFIIYFIFSI